MATYNGSDKRLKYLFQNGGGGSFICELLFENTNLTPSGASNVNKEFTLTKSIENYDAVLVSAFCYVNATIQEQVGTMMIYKSDFYRRAIGESGDLQIRWAYSINASIPTGRRSLAFGFADSTHIYTASRNTETGVEPMLYKVYGLNFGGSGHTYSTTEQVVGTWIDGKPLYEQVIHYTTTPTGDGWTMISLPVGCLVQDYAAYYHRKNPERVTKMSLFRSASPNEQVIANVQAEQMYVYVSSAFISGFSSIDIILRYTKSTD